MDKMNVNSRLIIATTVSERIMTIYAMFNESKKRFSGPFVFIVVCQPKRFSFDENCNAILVLLPKKLKSKRFLQCLKRNSKQALHEKYC